MSTRIRISNGRFARKKAEDSKQKKLAAMSAAKKKRISNILCESNENVCEGKRIVDVKVLAKNLRCSKCNERLYLDKVSGEKCTGLNSTLIICCDKCKTINEVRTNKEHECQAQQRIYSDINSAAVLGAVHSGMGCTALNKLLAIMNIPAILNDLYKRYEREVGPAIEKAAKESCRRAAEEERRLVIQNVTLTQITVTESVSSAYNVVYFDLETGGLSMTDDILQIAAISENREFNVYVNPTQPISPAAMNITGLSIIGGHLHFNNKVVSTIHIKDALIALHQFLSCSEKINVLVAHNAKFDVPRLLRAMVKNNVHLDITNIVGFVDTLTIFKKAFPERKGPGLFKLSTLAQDILGPDVLENFHNATFDVSVLQKLIKFLKKEDDLLKYMKPYETCLSDQLEYDTIKANLEKLHLLKGVVSQDLLKRMAKQNISFENLKEVYKNGGEESVYTFCTAKCESGKPKITRDKKAINKIITRLIQ